MKISYGLVRSCTLLITCFQIDIDSGTKIMNVNGTDRRIIRKLAREVKECAALNWQHKARLWRDHNDLKHNRPLLLYYPEGAWREIITAQSLMCENEGLRKYEFLLRARLTHMDILHDDLPIEPVWVVNKKYSTSPWWSQDRRSKTNKSANQWYWDPAIGASPSVWRDGFVFDGRATSWGTVLNNLDDLKKIKKPKWEYDEQTTNDEYELVLDLFGDILDVKLKGLQRLSFNPTGVYCSLRGHTRMLYDIYDEPEFMSDTLEFITQSSIELAKQAESLGILDYNNDFTYHSSGGVGYTNHLPTNSSLDGRIRLLDLWGSAESQEMAMVSPDMHDQFAMKYEASYLRLFGLNGYGCCDDLTNKLDYVLKLPSIRRISISPWADVKRCADKIGDQAIMSVKLNPALLAGVYDPQAVDALLDMVQEKAQNSIIEIIVKDTHTCNNDISRFVEVSRRFYDRFGE